MNKYEVGMLGNARPRPMAARQVARDNPVWVQAVADMVAGGEKTVIQGADVAENFTAAGGEKTGGSPASERENVTTLPESELFAYGIGQSWVFRFQTRRTAARFVQSDWRYVQYTVLDCFLRNTTQHYAVEMREEDDTAVNTAELTANRLRYLINFYLDRAVCAGERQPLPLPAETVVEWYAQERAKRAANAAQAKQMLAGHKEYQAARQKLLHAESMQAKADVDGDKARAAALADEVKDCRAALALLLDALGVTEDVLHPAPHCAVCGDRGILSNGRLCPCVKGNEAAIRRYWRRERGEENA